MGESAVADVVDHVYGGLFAHQVVDGLQTGTSLRLDFLSGSLQPIRKVIHTSTCSHFGYCSIPPLASALALALASTKKSQLEKSSSCKIK